MARLEHPDRRGEELRVRQGILVALTVSTGAVDAVSWLCLGKVFSAFMTGNLVFLGLRIGGAEGQPTTRVLASVAAFAAGATLGAWLVRPTQGNDAVWPSRMTLALTGTMVAQACFVGVWRLVDTAPSSAQTDLLVVLWSLAMGIQTTAIFSLGVRGVFTTAATATLATFMGDLSGWSQARGERWRLLTVVLGLVAGVAVGAALVDHARYWAPVFPLAITFAVVIATRFFPGGGSPGRRRTRDDALAPPASVREAG
jgi:uncharacterized membrane protein YoaK (UPF0700 family)